MMSDGTKIVLVMGWMQAFLLWQDLNRRRCALEPDVLTVLEMLDTQFKELAQECSAFLSCKEA